MVVHSCIEDAWCIGANAFVSGVENATSLSAAGAEAAGPKATASQPDNVVTIAPYSAVFQRRIVTADGMGHSVWTIFGVNDDLESTSAGNAESTATFFGRPFAELFARTGIREQDLWFADESHCLASARLFPVWMLDEQGRTRTPQLRDLLWLQPQTTTATDGKGQESTGDSDSAGSTVPASTSASSAATAAASIEAHLLLWRRSWRVSLQSLMAMSDIRAEFAWRRTLYFTIGDRHTYATLMAPEFDHHARAGAGLDQCLIPHFRACALAKRLQVLRVLDRVGETTTSPGVAARTLACVADMLGTMAGRRAGLRSGPGRNMAFAPAFALLERGETALGVRAMATERANWLGSSETLIRAARHYEAAAQILIRHAVMTARQFIKAETKTVLVVEGGSDATAPSVVDAASTDGSQEAVVSSPLIPGQYVEVQACARIDIAGGWTDTPPIAYEHGGVVVNAAVSLDGKRPIGARASRLAAPVIILVLEGGAGPPQRLEVLTLREVGNYTQPQSPGALLKAAFCCAGLVSLNAEEKGTLAQQLEASGGGFELHTWSNLPTGSGMGTSSILAGAVMAALWHAAGTSYTTACLTHAVLHLEQMLTTGGGWQDQVGGLVGGIKVARSAARLPLRVDVELLHASEDFLEHFTRHLVVIYTGKTRLARNLLQNVVRNWYGRSAFLVSNADALTLNAERCAQAVRDEDIAAMGVCLTAYWEQKKIMAPGCEPSFVRRMIEIMKPHAYGQSMAGAGGGGFMYVITKEADASARLEALVRAEIDVGDMTFHAGKIEREGMVVTRG